MATKTAGSPPKLTKTAFVRSLPVDLKAKEVVQKAKEAGLTISEAYVYVIRGAAKKPKKGSKGAPKTAAAKPAKSSKEGAPSKRTFIESQPADATAPAIIEAAKKVGLSISDTYIYVVRGRKRKAGGGRAKAAAAPAHQAATSTTAALRHVASKPVKHDSLTRFVEIVAGIGLDQAEALLAEFRAKITSIKLG